MSVFIEHTAGWFPFWCAPEQVRILTVNDKAIDYAKKIEEKLRNVVLDEPVKNNNLRYGVDFGDESLGKKIKKAVSMKIPAILIVGEKDMEEGVVSVRLRNSEEKIKLDEIERYLGELKQNNRYSRADWFGQDWSCDRNRKRNRRGDYFC